MALCLALAMPGLAPAQDIREATSAAVPGASGIVMEKTLERAVREALTVSAGTEQDAAVAADAPPKRWGRAVLGTIGVNVVFNLVNLAFRPDARHEFQVTPKTWWDNLRYGFIFDDNHFSTNSSATRTRATSTSTQAGRTG